MTQAQTQCLSWAYLKDETPFNEIFPDRRVPIRSIFPITPREEGCPPCYIVDAQFLSQEQIDRLAQQLFELWRPECESLQQAKEYISNGLPLKTDWFNGAGTSSPAILFGLMHDEGFGPKEEDEEFGPQEEDEEYDDDYIYFGEGDQ